MYTPDLQAEFLHMEASSHHDIPQEPEQFLGHYIDVLEMQCPTVYLDPDEAIQLLLDLLPYQPSRLQVAAARYVRETLIASKPLPF